MRVLLRLLALTHAPGVAQPLHQQRQQTDPSSLPAKPFQIIDQIDMCGPLPFPDATTLPRRFGITPRTAAQTLGQLCTAAGCNNSIVCGFPDGCLQVVSAFPSITDAAGYPHWNGTCDDSAGLCVNGGVPQRANLTAQLQLLEEIVPLWFPDSSWAGYGQLDWELWTPVWEENTGPGAFHSARYQDLSITLVKREHPSMSHDQAVAQAKQEYEAAALAWFVAVLDKLHELLPRSRWGF